MLDSLFWPVVPLWQTSQHLDRNGQPSVVQEYNLPPPQCDQYQRHDEAIYSLWMHFVDFCQAVAYASTLEGRLFDKHPTFCAPNVAVNQYTNRRRFQLFLSLAYGTSTPITPRPVSLLQAQQAQHPVMKAPVNVNVGGQVNTNVPIARPASYFAHTSPAYVPANPTMQRYTIPLPFPTIMHADGPMLRSTPVAPVAR